jgi:hypothetical protein
MPKLDEILEGLIAPEHGEFSADLARYVLGIRFTEEKVSRYGRLVEKNQEGGLEPNEREELDAYVTANSLLMILKSKARRSLVEHPSAA